MSWNGPMTVYYSSKGKFKNVFQLKVKFHCQSSEGKFESLSGNLKREYWFTLFKLRNKKTKHTQSNT